MNKQRLLAALLAVVLLSACRQEPQPETLALESHSAQVGYALGAALGVRIQQSGLTVDEAAVRAGLADALAGNALQLSQQQLAEIDQQLQADREQKAMAAFQQRAQQNAAAGQAFQQNYSQTDGVSVTASGLQYRIIQNGTGEQPTLGDQVVLHYQAKTVAGDVFDSTYQRGEPVAIELASLLPAMVEMLPQMAVGAKYELVAPPALAYGLGSKDGKVGPNETIIFIIELVAIKAG